MPLDPIRMTDAITTAYLNYLQTTFFLRDESLRRQFREALRQADRFVKGPILEATPPFATGASIADLIEEGVLTREFARLNSPRLPLARPLYRHQEVAVRKLVSGRRNLVVTTGTGSGKTETFLIPILDHLLRQSARHRLDPGVQALLLYPMNALANDQMARLRDLLAHDPAITFGRFTGETEDRVGPARERYQRMYRCDPLPNELIAREQMRAAPPHILLTNYAMLEYLLLRPADHVFFDGPYAHSWRFLVLDEAHTYTGAKGIEMALLLRRLKDRIVEGRTGILQCIATSATLGKGDESFPEAAAFAEKLFGERFAWQDEDPAQQDVVCAVRQTLQGEAAADWRAAPDLYLAWQAQVQQATSGSLDPLRLAAHAVSLNPADRWLLDLANACGANWRRFLYQSLSRSIHVRRLQTLLEQEPQYIGELAEAVFGDATMLRPLVALVDLAVKAKLAEEEASLLPARYHFFARAIEGAYVQLRPQRRLFLERREMAREAGRDYPVFELATCRRCGAGYLVGERQRLPERRVEVLRHPTTRFVEEDRRLEYFLLQEEQPVQPLDDEDDLVESEGEEAGEETYRLCAACGAIAHSQNPAMFCDCGPGAIVTLQAVRNRDGKVTHCPACGGRSSTGLVWRFLTGNDATASVLATAQYQQLPPKARPAADLAAETLVDEEWGAVSQARAAPPAPGRQLLIFSDNRQAAAFFAPYLNRTYSQIMWRRLILLALEERQAEVHADRRRLQDLVQPLIHLATGHGLLSGDLSPTKQRAEIWKWLLVELLAFDRRTSLEGLGCLGFALVPPAGWSAPPALLRLGLSDGEVWDLYQVLLANFRTKGAVEFPPEVDPRDEFFAPRNRAYAFVGRVAQGHSRRGPALLGWEPTGPKSMNARLDFLRRLYVLLMGEERSLEAAWQTLRDLWSRGLALHAPDSVWKSHFSSESILGHGVGYRIKATQWELRDGHVDPAVAWYRCNRCGNLSLFSVRGVCPTYACTGQLLPCNPAEELRDHHYRQLYTQLEPIPLFAQEHTAQLTGEAAAALQTRFVQGAVNVLSCSTTFELGVDVGELESVFMRNMPPSTANYLQRAGRAGRRTDATAYALTFAQRRAHDLAHFADPKRMVSGAIAAPYFEIANAKIVRRHVYATALAAFWKRAPHRFGTVEDFFFRTEGAHPAGVREAGDGVQQVREFLEERPQALQAALARIVPPEMHDDLGLANWQWVNELVGEQTGVLTKAGARVQNDIQQLEEARLARVAAGRPSDHILRVITTLRRMPLINYLSSQNVIPKYGFPVDVVSLQILHHAEAARDLELDRDLRIALAEYAPSSEVVAGGKLWTSRYLKRLPDRSWRSYRYAICDVCGCYQSILADTDLVLATCRACRQPLRGRGGPRTFVIPEFGFVAELDPPRTPGDAPPERTYITQTFYSGNSKEGAAQLLPLAQGRLRAVPAAEGTLAVVNQAGGRGFSLCYLCGYAVIAGETVGASHRSPWGGECRGALRPVHLGHEYQTDILHLYFEGIGAADEEFWLSLLYGLLEGASAALDIDRQDLDGVLYPYTGDRRHPALVLYDNVPGGAGHVHRIGQSPASLRQMLEATLMRLRRCECGGEARDTSCYGCLRNYYNQFHHDKLKRGIVIDFLERQL
ncbi:MAG TPA: DEAD/DEAH box helicase [Caldilineaceae bacterium]|nr:DEAD/DEAH box helicase [Caldilineaceae bacterium]